MPPVPPPPPAATDDFVQDHDAMPAQQLPGKSRSTLSRTPQSSGDTLAKRSSPDPVNDMSFLLNTLAAEGDTLQATAETPGRTAESFSQAPR